MALRLLARSRKQGVDLVCSALSSRQRGFAKQAASREDKEQDNKVQRLLKLLEPAPEVEFELSEADRAEWERRAKEYNRQSLRAHREWQKGLSTRLKLKKAALAALPEELRIAAMQLPTEAPPLDRQMFTETPPLPKEALASRDAAKEQSKRRIGTKHGKAA